MRDNMVKMVRRLLVRLGDAAALWLETVRAAASIAARRLKARAVRCREAARRAGRLAAHEDRAQGTTEYAILVGVLVVIAIVAIIAFRDSIQSLWNSITSNINALPTA